jgi:hypothetical protein
MAKKKSKRTRKPIKFEYKKGWKYVRERLVEPSRCARSSYRTVTRGNVKASGGRPPRGVQVISCCPKGYRRDAQNRCIRGSAHRPAVTQALRHTVSRFKSKHPSEWRELQEAKAGKKGIKTIRPGAKRKRTVRRKAKGKARTPSLYEHRRMELEGIALGMDFPSKEHLRAWMSEQIKAGREFKGWDFKDDKALRAYMSMQAGPGYQTGARLDEGLEGMLEF